MPVTHNPLAALGLLERRHDGPIPAAERRAALLGPLAERLLAAGEAQFFKRMVEGQIATIRWRREEGSFYPALIADLALYRREYRRWRAQLRALDRGEG